MKCKRSFNASNSQDVGRRGVALSGNQQCDGPSPAAGLPVCRRAYELSQRDRSVILVDRGPIAGGMTTRTSAHLAPLCNDLICEMLKIKGEAQSKMVAAVDRFEEV